MEPQLLDESSTLKYLGGIGRTTLYRIVKHGEVQRVKIGRRTFFTRASLDSYIADLARSATGAA